MVWLSLVDYLIQHRLVKFEECLHQLCLGLAYLDHHLALLGVHLFKEVEAFSHLLLVLSFILL